MVEWQKKSKRKPSGGISNTHRRRDKIKAERGRAASETTIGEKKIRKVRTKGQNTKVKIYSTKNGMLMESGKQKKVEILGVLENNANRQYARRNVLTKGAIVKIKDGASEKQAKVSNRPGQDGFVQMVLVK